jgi:hypothetical protein
MAVHTRALVTTRPRSSPALVICSKYKKKKCAGSVIVLCCCCVLHVCVCSLFFYYFSCFFYTHTVCMCVPGLCVIWPGPKRTPERNSGGVFLFFFPPSIFILFYFFSKRRRTRGGRCSCFGTPAFLYTRGCIISKCVHACGCVCVCRPRVCLYVERERVYLWFCYTGCAQCINVLPH